MQVVLNNQIAWYDNLGSLTISQDCLAISTNAYVSSVMHKAISRNL